MDRELPNIPKRMLVRRRMVEAEHLARRVLHQVDGRQRVCGRGFGGPNQGQVRVLFPARKC